MVFGWGSWQLEVQFYPWTSCVSHVCGPRWMWLNSSVDPPGCNAVIYFISLSFYICGALVMRWLQTRIRFPFASSVCESKTVSSLLLPGKDNAEHGSLEVNCEVFWGGPHYGRESCSCVAGETPSGRGADTGAEELTSSFQLCVKSTFTFSLNMYLSQIISSSYLTVMAQ